MIVNKQLWINYIIQHGIEKLKKIKNKLMV